jgi:hypothetical protein
MLGASRGASTRIGGGGGAGAVTIDTVTPGGPFATDISFNHTSLAAGANIAVLGWGMRQNSALLSTAITFGGIQPSGFDEQLLDTTTDVRVYWAWWLDANLPAAGANIAILVDTGAAARGTACMYSLIGASQTAPQVVGGTVNTGTTLASTALTAAGGSFIAAAWQMNSGTTVYNAPTGGTGTWTLRFGAGGVQEPNNDDRVQIADLLNQSGSVTPSISWTGAQFGAMNAIRVNPA